MSLLINKKKGHGLSVTSYSPDCIAHHLETEVKNKTCVSPSCSLVNVAIIESEAKKKTVFENLLQEYFSDDSSSISFGNVGHSTGGIPYKIISPYLVRIGYDIKKIKHVIYNIYPTQFQGIDPKSVKLARLCQNYLN